MVGFAFIVALIVSMYAAHSMLSDRSRMGHTYASQIANGNVVSKITSLIFITVFFLIYLLELIISNNYKF